MSAIGCATVLEPVIENKRRKIDPLTDDRSLSGALRGASVGLFYILMRSKCLHTLLYRAAQSTGLLIETTLKRFRIMIITIP